MDMISLESKVAKRKANEDQSGCSVRKAICLGYACQCPVIWFGWHSGLWADGDACQLVTMHSQG